MLQKFYTMKSNLCFLIMVLVLFGTALPENSDYQNWYAKVFGHNIGSDSLKPVLKSIIKVPCNPGFVRVGRECLIVDDYDYVSVFQNFKQ